MGWMDILDKVVAWLIPAVCAGIVAWAARQIKTARRERDVERAHDNDVREGVQALLRDRIIWTHSHYSERGEYPIYARENVEAMYRSYHALGGNGTITALVHEMEQLPVHKD